MYTDLKIYVLRCINRTIRPTGGSPITDTVRAAIKTGDTIKIMEQLQRHFSNNFILLIGGFSKMAWKVTERIGFTIFKSNADLFETVSA